MSAKKACDRFFSGLERLENCANKLKLSLSKYHEGSGEQPAVKGVTLNKHNTVHRKLS